MSTKSIHGERVALHGEDVCNSLLDSEFISNTICIEILQASSPSKEKHPFHKGSGEDHNSCQDHLSLPASKETNQRIELTWGGISHKLSAQHCCGRYDADLRSLCAGCSVGTHPPLEGSCQGSEWKEGGKVLWTAGGVPDWWVVSRSQAHWEDWTVPLKRWRASSKATKVPKVTSGWLWVRTEYLWMVLALRVTVVTHVKVKSVTSWHCRNNCGVWTNLPAHVKLQGRVEFALTKVIRRSRFPGKTE